jgi:putative polyketide hydroxylase
MSRVLIAGGGMAGLAMAAFLSWHDVDCLLVERHHEISPHPRARGLNPRTMELMRSVGLEAEIKQSESAMALRANHGVIAMESLAGREIGTLREDYFQDTTVDVSALSPAGWCLCHQDEYEPILRRFAERLGAEIRFASELVGYERDATGLRATIRDLTTGHDLDVPTSFLVAADGAGSPVRQGLGIPFSGAGTIGHYLNIHFSADTREVLGERRFIMAYVFNDGVRCGLLPIDNSQRWLLHVPYDPASEQLTDFDEQRCQALARAAVGIPGLPVKILNVRPWEAAGRTAGRFADGNVFLVGDAAHVMPPSGAFGSNTAIQDAHNLAWKMAAVLTEKAPPSLLATYDAERRPVGSATVGQAVLRAGDRPRLVQEKAAQPDPAIVPDTTVWFGARYGTRTPWVNDPRGLPGTRAPHISLSWNGHELSALDLFGRTFVLIAGPRGAAWRHAASRLAITAYLIGTDIADVTGRWCEAYGVSAEGAVLVRPDGVVAWRSVGTEPAPATVLAAAVRGALTLS